MSSDADHIKPRLRQDKVYELRDYLGEWLKSYEAGLVQTCLSCINFRESDEQCTKFRARPPARVIAYGCKDYFSPDEIPF